MTDTVSRPVATWIDKLSHMHAPQKMLLDWMRRFTSPIHPKLLDVGCGSTGLSMGIRTLGFNSVLVDLDPKSGAAQNTRFMHANFGAPLFYSLDIGKDRLPGVDYDYVVCAYCHQHVKDEAQSRHFFSEVRRVLKPSGYFVLVDRISDKGHTYWWERPGDPMWVRTWDDLRTLLESCGLAIDQVDGFTYAFNTNAALEPAAWVENLTSEALCAIVKASRS